MNAIDISQTANKDDSHACVHIFSTEIIHYHTLTFYCNQSNRNLCNINQQSKVNKSS